MILHYIIKLRLVFIILTERLAAEIPCCEFPKLNMDAAETFFVFFYSIIEF